MSSRRYIEGTRSLCLHLGFRSICLFSLLSCIGDGRRPIYFFALFHTSVSSLAANFSSRFVCSALACSLRSRFAIRVRQTPASHIPSFTALRGLSKHPLCWCSDGKVRFQTSVRTRTGLDRTPIWGSGSGDGPDWTPVGFSVQQIPEPRRTPLNGFRTRSNLNWRL